jgi:hypothetical protein
MKKAGIVLIFVIGCNFGFSQVLPKNPQPGKCYVRCFTQEDKNDISFKPIDCSYLKPQPLKISLTHTEDALSKKDKKQLKKIYKHFLKKGIKIQISVYHDGLVTYEDARSNSEEIATFLKTMGASENIFNVEILKAEKANKTANNIMYGVDVNSYFTNHR